MKTQSTNLFSQLTKTEVKNLTIEVKETLAMGYAHNQGKIFSAVELWNIQRQRKNVRLRRGFAY